MHLFMMVLIGLVASMQPPELPDMRTAGAGTEESESVLGIADMEVELEGVIDVGSQKDTEKCTEKAGAAIAGPISIAAAGAAAADSEGRAKEGRAKEGRGDNNNSDTNSSGTNSSDTKQADGYVLIGSSRFWLYAVGIMLGMLTYTSVANSIIPHLLLVGFTPSSAAALLSAMALTNLLTKLLTGYLADRCGGAPVLIGSMLLQIVAIVVLCLSGGDPAGVIPGVLLYGAGYGSFIPLKTIVVLEAVGVVQFGKGSGMVEGLSLVPGIVGPLMLGACVDRTGSYVTGFYGVCGAFAVGMVCLHAARQPTRRSNNGQCTMSDEGSSGAPK
jgi:hypothetical protein